MTNQPTPAPDDDPAENVRRCYVHKCGSLFNVTSDYAISDDYEPISERAYRLLSAHARSEAPLIARVRALLAEIHPVDGFTDLIQLMQYTTDAIEVVRKERERARDWSLALQSLTPGGSEFVDDPGRCVAHVRGTREFQHETIVRQQRQLATLSSQIDVLVAESDRRLTLVNADKMQWVDEAARQSDLRAAANAENERLVDLAEARNLEIARLRKEQTAAIIERMRLERQIAERDRLIERQQQELTGADADSLLLQPPDQERVERADECGHDVALHYRDGNNDLRCRWEERGTSTRGVIGLPTLKVCDCINGRKFKRGASHGREVGIDELPTHLREMVERRAPSSPAAQPSEPPVTVAACIRGDPVHPSSVGVGLHHYSHGQYHLIEARAGREVEQPSEPEPTWAEKWHRDPDFRRAELAKLSGASAPSADEYYRLKIQKNGLTLLKEQRASEGAELATINDMIREVDVLIGRNRCYPSSDRHSEQCDGRCGKGEGQQHKALADKQEGRS